VLHQTERVRAINVVETRETVECSQSAVGGDGEDRPLPVTATKDCRAVQLAVARLHQTGFGVSPVDTVEAVQDGYDARRGELENAALAAVASGDGRTVHIAIGGQKKASLRRCNVGKLRECAAGGDLEDRSGTVGASAISHAVKSAIGSPGCVPRQGFAQGPHR